jgi:hypothetical protein
MGKRIRHWIIGALKSLTMWVNSLAGTLVIFLPELKEALPELAPHLGPETYKWLALVVIVSNLVLRAKTNKSLTKKGTT